MTELVDIEKRVPVKVLGASEKAVPKHHPEELDHGFKGHLERQGNSPTQLEGTRSTPGHRPCDQRQARQRGADLFDSGSEYRVLLELPGVTKEDLDIALSAEAITIEAGARADLYVEREGLLRGERAHSKILRSATFPEEVMAEKAEASLNNGVLEVRIPKRTKTKGSKHLIIMRLSGHHE